MCIRDRAVEVAYLRAAAELVSPHLGDQSVAYVLAAAQRTGPHCGRVRAAHAEGADADEPAVGQRDHGHHGIDRAEDSTRHSGRRTGRGQTGGNAKLAHSSQPRGDRRQSHRKLAAGTAVYVEAGGGPLRLLPAADGGVRSGDRKTAERLAVAASGDGPPVESAAPPKKRKKAQGNSPEFDLGKNWCESRFGTWWDLGEQTRQFGFCRGALTLDCLIK